MAQKRQPEEPQRETIRAFETQRDIYIGFDHGDGEVVFLTAIEDATKDDVAEYCNNNLPDVRRVDSLADELYRLWGSNRWQEVRTNKKAEGVSDDKIAALLVTDYAKGFVGVRRYPVPPQDPARRRAYHDRKEAERRERIERTLAAPANNVDPEVAALLKQRDEIDTKLTEARNRVAQTRHREMVAQREEAAVGG